MQTVSPNVLLCAISRNLSAALIVLHLLHLSFSVFLFLGPLFVG